MKIIKILVFILLAPIYFPLMIFMAVSYEWWAGLLD